DADLAESHARRTLWSSRFACPINSATSSASFPVTDDTDRLPRNGPWICIRSGKDQPVTGQNRLCPPVTAPAHYEDSAASRTPLTPQGLGIGWCLDTVFVRASSPELACNGDRFAQKPRIWFWIPEYTARCRSGIR